MEAALFVLHAQFMIVIDGAPKHRKYLALKKFVAHVALFFKCHVFFHRAAPGCYFGLSQ